MKFGKSPKGVLSMRVNIRYEIGETLPVTVNYDLSLGELFRQAYPSCPSLESLSPRKCGIAKIEMVLVHYPDDVCSIHVLEELKAENLRPADLAEAVAFRSQYPELKHHFIALGGILRIERGDCYVPFLSQDGSLELYATPDYPEYQHWASGCYFAAVRN